MQNNKIYDSNVKVVSNEVWAEAQGVITLQADDFVSRYNAGQMCMLSVVDRSADTFMTAQNTAKIGVTTDPLLNRPFAPYEVNHNRGTIKIMYAVVGRGTNLLTDIKPGAHLRLTKPNGKPFTIVNEESVALVAGGVGVAPMMVLAHALQRAGNDVTLYFGARSSSLIYPPILDEEYLFNLVVSTEDGSAGHTGFATTQFEKDLASGKEYVYCYTCGPKPMMKIVHNICMNYSLPLEVSLEEKMACGIGACYGCMVSIKDEIQKDEQSIIQKRCCTEGPVFDSRLVIW